MSRISGRGTRPEIQLRKMLWREGLRYRLDYRLPGRPDLTFVTFRVAVFMDGCFWHGCPLHYSAPAVRQQFWGSKLRENIERDLHVEDALSELGWRSLRVWQHELKNRDRLLQRIRLVLGEDVCARRGDKIGLETNSTDFTGLAATSYLRVNPPWYYCDCGSDDVRVLVVSDPGSLRLSAKRRPQWVELICVRCRHKFTRSTS